jgi:mono/diheme cytochrome c family protein
MKPQRASPLERIAIAVALLAFALWAAYGAGTGSQRPPSLDDLSLRLDLPNGSPEGNDLRDWLVAGAPEAVVRGAIVYDLNCAVCHGDTGLGYAEAKLAFPEDHRGCTRCHRPGNEREMSFETMNERVHNLFDVGNPPALRGPSALTSFPSDTVLLAYTRATMPRYQPGRLSDEEYAQVVAFMRWIGTIR